MPERSLPPGQQGAEAQVQVTEAIVSNPVEKVKSQESVTYNGSGTISANGTVSTAFQQTFADDERFQLGKLKVFFSVDALYDFVAYLVLSDGTPVAAETYRVSTGYNEVNPLGDLVFPAGADLEFRDLNNPLSVPVDYDIVVTGVKLNV